MNNILLDTNAYARLLAGEEDILDILADAEIVYMSIFVLGELFAGFEGGKRRKKNIEMLDLFLRKPTVKILNATSETGKIFGRVKQSLTNVGTPIPINDVWIATHALETGAALITYDRHFMKVPGLRLGDLF